MDAGRIPDFIVLVSGRNNRWIKNDKILLAHGSGGKLATT